MVATVAVAAFTGFGADAASAATDTTGTATLPQGSEPVTLDPADFTVNIDNPYFPMKPGTRWTYRGAEGKHPVKDVLVATTATKKIANGIGLLRAS